MKILFPSLSLPAVLHACPLIMPPSIPDCAQMKPHIMSGYENIYDKLSLFFSPFSPIKCPATASKCQLVISAVGGMRNRGFRSCPGNHGHGH